MRFGCGDAFCTDTFLQTDDVTHRNLYTEQLLRADILTQRGLFTEKMLYTDAFTHRGFRQRRKYLHTKPFPQRSLCTEQFFLTSLCGVLTFCSTSAAVGLRPPPAVPPSCLYQLVSINLSLSTCLYQLVSINWSLSTRLYQLVSINLSLSTSLYQLLSIHLSLSTAGALPGLAPGTPLDAAVVGVAGAALVAAICAGDAAGCRGGLAWQARPWGL